MRAPNWPNVAEPMVRRSRSTTATTGRRLLSAAAALCLATTPLARDAADAFSPVARPTPMATGGRRRARPTSVRSKPEIIDAEVIPDDGGGDESSARVVAGEARGGAGMTLVEYSQSQDPDWRSMPVAFCDAASGTYVDCTLAFYVKDPLDATAGAGDDADDGGARYALGVPCEVPIVVALETEDDDVDDGGAAGDDDANVVSLSKVVPLDPDGTSDDGTGLTDEGREEAFQFAARALADEFGPSIRLKKTPRVLTVEGDLDGAVGDWREVLLGGSGGDGEEDAATLSLEDALDLFSDDDGDDGQDFFDKIMRRDLGDDYMKLVEDDDDDMDDELLKLFDPAGLDVDLDELTREIGEEEKKVGDGGGYEELVRRLQPSAAIRLVNFLGPGGREYTVLRPLRPILLVGREDPDDYTRRVLLTEEEGREVLPRLERACREELEGAGFFLAGAGEGDEGSEGARP